MSAKNTQRGNQLVRAMIIVGAILLALIGTALVPLLNQDANYVSRLQQRVTAELPPSSTESTVNQWLRTNNKFLPTRLVPPQIDMVQGRDVIDLAGMPRRQVASMLRATVPLQDVVSQFKQEYVRIYFFFDEQGRLIGNYFLRWSDIARMEREAG